MKKILIGLALVAVVAGFFFPRPAVLKLGGTVENFPVKFTNGLRAGSTDQLSISAAGTITTSGGIVNTGNFSGATYSSASIGASSSTPAALGSASSGHFIIATSGNTGSASTTVVTANSTIILQREATTPIAGTTCNSTATTTPIVTSKIAGNGFVATSAANPVTNPICLAYWIIN